MSPLDLSLMRDVLLAALREDIGSGDVTTRATVAGDRRASARYTTKQALVVSGLPVVEEMLHLTHARLDYKPLATDGDDVEKGTAIAEVQGSAHEILTLVRVTLNLLQRMCGIATLTRQYVDRVKGTPARVVD